MTHSNTSNFSPYLVNSVCCGSLYGNKALTGFAVLRAELSNKQEAQTSFGTGSTNAREVELTFQARK